MAQITFFSEMPSILIAPFAGAVVDKYSRKKVRFALVLLEAGIKLSRRFR